MTRRVCGRTASEEPAIVILGCGYTGTRVAWKMAGRGRHVLATSRDPSRLRLPETAVTIRVDTAEPSTVEQLAKLPEGCLVLHSVPLVEEKGKLSDPTPLLLRPLEELAARVVYLSTTSVYGAQTAVDARTPPAPRTARERLRVAAEEAVKSGRWSWMILRPAAIYGPGRGMQVSLPRGEFKLAGDGSNWVSRIHVDDLAELACAALLSEAQGAWPVADLEPARSREVAAFVAELTGSKMPESSPAAQLHSTRQANRRVDGTEVLKLLGLTLQFPSYRIGIPKSLGL